MAHFERVVRNLGRNVSRARNIKRLTQQELADLIQMPRSTLSAIEGGKGNPSLQSLALISEALNVSVNELMSTRKHHTWDVSATDLENKIYDQGRVRIYGLLPKQIGTVHLRRLEIDPSGKLDNEPGQPQAKEYLNLLTGHVVLRTEESSEFLRAPASVHFRCDQPYSYENYGEETAIMIAAVLQVTMI